MTAEQIARALKARRTGKGKWQCKCTSHPDRTASLSITDMGNGRTRLHCFSGCSQAAVLACAGMTWKDLRPGNVSPEIRQMLSLEDRRELLERRLGLVIVLQAIDRRKRKYWTAAERGIQTELNGIRCLLGPECVLQEWRERMFKERISKYGWDALMEEVWERLSSNE